jgi:16S rRNA (uracil1498-N3)-methyltransferase
LELTLVQCLLKSDKMDWIVQKAVELGTNKIQPLASRNCVAQYDGKKAKQRQERWQKIADEAAKQCGRTKLLQVEPIMGIKELLAKSGFGEDNPLYFCYENEEQKTIKEALTDSQAGKATVIIGPEGGFSDKEVALCVEKGCEMVSLGRRILRAETAAIYGAALLGALSEEE